MTKGLRRRVTKRSVDFRGGYVFKLVGCFSTNCLHYSEALHLDALWPSGTYALRLSLVHSLSLFVSRRTPLYCYAVRAALEPLLSARVLFVGHVPRS